jgi:hypothetical protein
MPSVRRDLRELSAKDRLQVGRLDRLRRQRHAVLRDLALYRQHGDDWRIPVVLESMRQFAESLGRQFVVREETDNGKTADDGPAG